WFRPTQILSARAGLHRLVWDLHYPPPGALEFAAPISAVFQNTWKEPRGPWAVPGEYQIKLTVDGRSVTQPLTLKMDPRIRTPIAGLRRQFAISMQLKQALDQERAAIDELRAMRRELAERRKAATGELGAALDQRDKELQALEGEAADEAAPRPRPGQPAPRTLTALNARLVHAFSLIQAADVTPTPQLERAAEGLVKDLNELMARWNRMKTATAYKQ